MLGLETTTIYLITMSSFATILILSHLFRLAGSLVYRSALSWFYKLFMRTEVFHRRKSTDSISVLSFCYICVYIGANVALCAVGISSRRALAKRCGTLCLVNLIPLSLGGRLSFLTHALSRVRPWNQSLAHRWIGRVCLLQGACHGILGMLVGRATTVQILVGPLESPLTNAASQHYSSNSAPLSAADTSTHIRILLKNPSFSRIVPCRFTLVPYTNRRSSSYRLSYLCLCALASTADCMALLFCISEHRFTGIVHKARVLRPEQCEVPDDEDNSVY
jgi:hypothetical protein